MVWPVHQSVVLVIIKLIALLLLIEGTHAYGGGGGSSTSRRRSRRRSSAAMPHPAGCQKVVAPPAGADPMVWHIFQAFDSDCSKKLDLEELTLMIGNAPDEVNRTVAMLDHNGDTHVDFQEFENVVCGQGMMHCNSHSTTNTTLTHSNVASTPGASTTSTTILATTLTTTTTTISAASPKQTLGLLGAATSTTLLRASLKGVHVGANSGTVKAAITRADTQLGKDTASLDDTASSSKRSHVVRLQALIVCIAAICDVLY